MSLWPSIASGIESNRRPREGLFWGRHLCLRHRESVPKVFVPHRAPIHTALRVCPVPILPLPRFSLCSLLLCGCSDHTLIGNITKSRDSGRASGTADSEPTDSAQDDTSSPDTAPPEPTRVEGEQNLAEDGWSGRRIGELTAFQPKIDLAVADLNGDGAAEVVVGAPGWLDPADHGAVYVASGPMSGDGLLADEVRLQGDARMHYTGFTVAVGSPASADYPVLAVGSHQSVPDVFLVHGPITASAPLSSADASIQYRGAGGTAAWAGRDLTWSHHNDDAWLLVGNALALDGRGAIHVHAGTFEGTLPEAGIGIISGPTPRPEDGPPRISCHASTVDAAGMPRLFVAAPGIAENAGAVFRVDLSDGADALPLELDDLPSTEWVLGPAPEAMIGVFNDGWRCLLETGDITGDGVDDLVVGAPQHNNHAGSAWVLNGAAPLGGISIEASPALLATIPGDLPAESSSTTVCEGSCVGYGVQLGDWDEAGTAELAVGRIRDFGAASLIWYGPVSGTLTPAAGSAGSPDLLIKGSGTEMVFADGNGDGTNDLFLAESAKQYDADETLLGQGGVWMIPGI